MTKLLDKAFDRARSLSPQEQDDIAEIVLRLTGQDGPVYQLTPEEEADLIVAEGEMERGEFATEAQVKAIWAKYDR